MARRHVYLLTAALSAITFAGLVVVSNNFYWGASQAAGGDYFLFGRPLPHPLGPLVWAVLKPLLLVTPVVTAWSVYKAARNRHSAGGNPVCRSCGYDLTGNVSGVCPECAAPVALGGGK